MTTDGPPPAAVATPAQSAGQTLRPTLVTAPGIASTLLAGLRALFLLRPEARLRLRPATQFWWLALLSIGISLLVQGVETPHPWLLNADGLRSDATTTLLLLAFSHAAAHLARLPPRAWTLAILLSAALCALTFVAPALQWLAVSRGIDQQMVFALLCLWWVAICVRVGWHVLAASGLPAWRRLSGPLLLALILCSSWLLLTQERYIYTDPQAQAEEYAAEEGPEPPQIEGSAEQVMMAQPRLLDLALSRIRRGDPARPELFVIAFGGDGNEQVFHNEVEYIDALFSSRFDAAQRVLKLVNSVHTTDSLPLATLSNLRRALRAMRERMDGDDLLFLYLTSHGSPDHELFVNLLPLPLDQITPETLADALREAEIGTRIILISACYSGGFLDALADPRALVMTAARHDRPSFGCGAESDITYFGHAYLVDALNQERDFGKAFAIARQLVTAREKAERFDPSRPQVQAGSAVQPALNAWLATLPPAPAEALPFKVAVERK